MASRKTAEAKAKHIDNIEREIEAAQGYLNDMAAELSGIRVRARAAALHRFEAAREGAAAALAEIEQEADALIA